MANRDRVVLLVFGAILGVYTGNWVNAQLPGIDQLTSVLISLLFIAVGVVVAWGAGKRTG